MSGDRDRWVQVQAGEVRIAISGDHPVGLVRGPGTEVVVSWPDLDVGSRATSITVLAAPTGAWVFYRPDESEDPALPDGKPAAVHIATDGQITRFTEVRGHQPLGVTRHGLWVTADAFPKLDDPSAWQQPRHAEVLIPGGSSRIITTDRRIAFVMETDTSPRLILYSGAPAATTARLGGTTYSYRYASVALGDELPAEINIADDRFELFDEQELLRAMGNVAPRPLDVAPIESPIPWSLIHLSTAEQNAAVASTLREFDHLASYWHGQDGRTSPLSRGLGDPRVEPVGEWPHTRVEVSFTHPHFPGGRLRRTLRVFDEAGRVRPSMYASIHLMEDLDTSALPDPANAHNGVLDI
ncbi:hypothetical protein [Microbacterium kyungheense]|uniref:hypothetical protein n=1 Tax=Microbacterium kyungheense TaxID=1263636 RepID=UPI001151BE8B|nr:hypothetical protein [Microbacterium kyungheense]